MGCNLITESNCMQVENNAIIGRLCRLRALGKQPIFVRRHVITVVNYNKTVILLIHAKVFVHAIHMLTNQEVSIAFYYPE